MTVFNQFRREVPIIFGATSLLATDAVNIVADDIQANERGRKELPAGLFCARVNGRNRLLPRTRLATALSSSANTINFREPHGQFKANDQLWVLGCYARLTVTEVANSTSYHIVVNNRTLTVTTPATGNTTTTLATAIVNATVGSPARSFWETLGITATSTGAVIELFSGDSWSIQTSPQITVWTSSNDGFFGNYYAPIGTIQTNISTLNPNGTRTYSLETANQTGRAIPAGCIVGTLVDRLLGVHIQSIDLTEDAPFTGTEFSVAPIRMADGVYENNLPYVDELIKRDNLIGQLNINPINTPFDNTRNYVTRGAFPTGIN